jgi:hypothetical protein
MTSKYKINPCKACEKKLQRTRCNVNTMNDCCYATLAAFSGATSSNAINNDESANNCKECVQKVMNGMGVFGRTPCDLKLSAPPLWQQSPHYLPSLLNDGKTPDEARNMCMFMCKETQYPNMCMENCQTDYDALELIPIQKRKQNIEKFNEISSEKKGMNKAMRVTLLVLVLLILITIILYFLRSTKKSQLLFEL